MGVAGAGAMKIATLQSVPITSLHAALLINVTAKAFAFFSPDRQSVSAGEFLSVFGENQHRLWLYTGSSSHANRSRAGRSSAPTFT